MKTFIRLLLFIVLFGSALPRTTFARGKRKPRSTSPSPAPTPVNLNDHIVALSLTSVIINAATTHQCKEYKVTPSTKFTANGKVCTLQDLAVGMDVLLTTLPNDPTTAANVDATTAKR